MRVCNYFMQPFRFYVTWCLTSGNMPKAWRPLQILGQYVARTWILIQVGRLKLVGAEHLNGGGRMIYCPNHSSMFDAIAIFSVIKRPLRYMTYYTEMSGAGGIDTVVMAALGCYAVGPDNRNAVVSASVKKLVQGESLCIFAEGNISPSGELLPFKKGAATIVGAAWKELEGSWPVGLVPIRLEYDQRHAASARGPFPKMGFKWRGGMTVTIFPPIYASGGQSDEELIGRVRKVIAGEF